MAVTVCRAFACLLRGCPCLAPQVQLLPLPLINMSWVGTSRPGRQVLLGSEDPADLHDRTLHSPGGRYPSAWPRATPPAARAQGSPWLGPQNRTYRTCTCTHQPEHTPTAASCPGCHKWNPPLLPLEHPRLPPPPVSKQPEMEAPSLGVATPWNVWRTFCLLDNTDFPDPGFADTEN